MSFESYQNFKLNGYEILQDSIPEDLVKSSFEQILYNIHKCYKELGLTEQQYLSVVSRWSAPSPVCYGLETQLIPALQEIAQRFSTEKIELCKLNVICKNKFFQEEIPFHQDISYNRYNPYEFSVWLSLNNVSEESGTLEIIPKSHNQTIYPAVDFWSPEYIANHRLKESSEKLKMRRGDILVFDSRIWHGSSKKTDTSERYAVVTRWRTKNSILKFDIPPIMPMFFGMWNCKDYTKNILSKTSKKFSTLKIDNDDFLELLNIWLNLLKTKEISLEIPREKAISSIENLIILEKACIKHNGGDAAGKIYKSLWHNLLSKIT